MTPQERDVIAGIFDRLKPAASQPRDPEAEKLIADRLKEQPYAAYAMAQSVYVQEQALTNLQGQVEALQAQVADMQRAAQAQPQPQQGGFLSGIFGGGARPAAPAQPMQAPAGAQAMQARPGGPWGNAGQQAPGPWGQPQQAAPAAGGGFMATALTTAAGVAGGMVVGNMLMNAFSGSKDTGAGASQASHSGSAAGESSAQTASLSDQSGANEASSGYSEASHQSASYDDGSYGGDDGGGDDSWA